jgi:hypothetical protein
MPQTIRIGTVTGVAYLVPAHIIGIRVVEVDEHLREDGLAYEVEVLTLAEDVIVDRYTELAGANAYADQLRRELDLALLEAAGSPVTELDASLEVMAWGSPDPVRVLHREPDVLDVARLIVGIWRERVSPLANPPLADLLDELERAWVREVESDAVYRTVKASELEALRAVQGRHAELVDVVRDTIATQRTTGDVGAHLATLARRLELEDAGA